MSYNIDMALAASLPPAPSAVNGDGGGPLPSELEDIKEVSVLFVSTLRSIPPLPSHPFTVPVHLTRLGLSEVVNALLSLPKPRPFDFVLDGSLVRSSLLHCLQRLGKGVGETGLTIEVVEALHSPQRHRSTQPHPDWIASVHSRSPAFTATACYDRQVRLVRRRTRRERRGGEDEENVEEEEVIACEGHTSAVKVVRVSRVDGRWAVVSGGKDHSVRLWDVEEEDDEEGEGVGGLRCSAVGLHHSGGVEAVAWLEGSGRFVSGGWDQRLLVWDVHRREEAEEEAGGPPKKLKTSAQSRPFASSPPSRLSPVSSISGASLGLLSGLCSPFPTALYSASADSSLRHFDLATAAQGRVWWMGGGVALTSVDLSADGRSAVVGCWDGAVRLVDVRQADGKAAVLSSHLNVVSAVAFSPLRGHLLTSASYDGTVKVWDVRARVPLLTLRPMGGDAVQAGELSADRLFAVQWVEGESGGGSDEGQLLSAGTDCRLHTHSWRTRPRSTAED